MNKTTKYTLIGLTVTLCTVVFLVWFIRASIKHARVVANQQRDVKAVTRFHALYNAGRYKDIYTEAHPIFKKTGKLDAWMLAMTQTRKKYGKILSAQQIGQAQFFGGQIRLIYNCQFAGGPMTEMFTLQSNGPDSKLGMYRIFPGSISAADVAQAP